MSESKRTRVMCKFLEDRGALIFAVVASLRQEPGWPDRYIAPPGVWLEFKLRSKPTPKQAWVLEQLTLRGAQAYVVRHLDGNFVDIEDHSGRCLREGVPWHEFIGVLKEL